VKDERRNRMKDKDTMLQLNDVVKVWVLSSTVVWDPETRSYKTIPVIDRVEVRIDKVNDDGTFGVTTGDVLGIDNVFTMKPETLWTLAKREE